MSIKLVLLKTGDQIITDVKELVSDESVRGYVFNKPHKLESTKTLFLTEETENTGSVQVTFSPWIILTEDEDILVSPEWIVTIVEPVKSIVEMYQERLNGESD